MQGRDDDYGVKMEENGTLSIQVIYEPKSLTFKTLFLGGHLIQSKEKRFEFAISPAALNHPKIMFEYVYFTGTSLDVSYVGFSKQPSGTLINFLFLLLLLEYLLKTSCTKMQNITYNSSPLILQRLTNSFKITMEEM